MIEMIRGQSILHRLLGWSPVLLSAIFLLMVASVPTGGAQYQTQRVAFLRLVEDQGKFVVFTADTTGARPVRLITDHVRALQSLSKDILAVETESRSRRLVQLLDLSARTRRTVYELREFEPFPILAGDGTRLLTVASVGSAYVIELLTIGAPYRPAEIIAQSKIELSPKAWPCAGGAAFFLEHETRRIVRLDVGEGSLANATPADLEGYQVNGFSLSCDERLLAVSANPPGDVSRNNLYVYQDGIRTKTIASGGAIEPAVSKDGNTVFYVDGYGEPKNRLMRYSVALDKIFEVVGPESALATPVILE